MSTFSISLVGLRNKSLLEEIAEKHENLSFELTSSMSRDELEELLPIIKGRVRTIHALCPNRSFTPNLASSDLSVVKTSIDAILEDAELANRVGASVLTLHPGYIIDERIPSNAIKRIELMERSVSKRLILRKEGAICTLDYPESSEYRNAFLRLKENVALIAQKLLSQGISLAIENLNPRAGYMLMLPSEMVELKSIPSIRYTLDIGHLWISSCHFGFDFLEAVRTICDTGRVVNAHIHSNRSLPSSLMSLEDSHDNLDVNPIMPWAEAVKIIGCTSSFLTLETLYDPEKNIELLNSCLNS